MRITIFFLLALITLSGFSQLPYRTGFVIVNGKKTSYNSSGLESRKSGEPLMIFQNGGVTPKENWDTLFHYLPKTTTWITYDRPGIGQSQEDTTIVNDVDVVKHLHLVLQSIKAAPPYVLIGHSYGGPLIRLFTALYPSEVSGLVLIDPTDFMWTPQHEEQLKQTLKDTIGWVGRDEKKFAEMLGNNTLSTGYRSELKRLYRDLTSFFIDYRSLPPLHDIPVTVFIAYNAPTTPLIKMHVSNYLNLVENNKRGSVICLPKFKHFMHLQDPNLIARGIQMVYESSLRTNSNQ